MSAEESQVPGPPTWREYLDARLGPLATKEYVHVEVERLKDTLNAAIWKAAALLAALLAVATTIILTVR